ncbi:MAG: hypothetical protein SGJ15_06010 [Bacteroidota bacterium]|nr:hypothetical protein [Bacteroidota bacterium]
MTKINNIIKPVMFATLGSAAISISILNFFQHSPQNLHWIYSIVFHLTVAIVIAILGLVNPDPKALASNLLSISLGRLLASGIAFLFYSQTFPETQKWFMVHFMMHYVLFTFFEILFLLKIVTAKTSNK